MPKFVSLDQNIPASKDLPRQPWDPVWAAWQETGFKIPFSWTPNNRPTPKR